MKINNIRDSWGSRFGVIMAVAGSAIGLGNLLRFPAKVAANGGGAFLIPYFVAFLFVGLPLIWAEWTLGRLGGALGHGTAPGVFHALDPRRRWLKYLGVIGIFGPMVILSYYIFIESWTLAYSFFALFGRLENLPDALAMRSFLRGFQGVEQNSYFNNLSSAYIFFCVTFGINILVLYHGIKGGIEKLCNIAVPLLFVCAIILMLRVFTLGSPDALRPDWNPFNGMGFLWNPDFSKLLSARVWLEATGQIFFTLSVGMGVILAYASYLKKHNDVALSGLTAASTNQVAEVILGGSIIIPAAFVFFGPVDIQTIAQAGTFDLGFVTMPSILNQLPLSKIFSFLWFFLLFIAGITSSVSISLPAISFLKDEFHWSHRKAVFIFALVGFLIAQPAIFFLRNGVVDELDFWAGSLLIVIFALIEILLFGWFLGIKNAWKELHHGAELNIPSVYKFIIKYITPLFLFFILGMWITQEWGSFILMKTVSLANQPYVLWTRVGLVFLFIFILVLVKISWRMKNKERSREVCL